MTEVPLNWASATGKDLFSLVRGVSYDKSDASDQPGDDFVPILRANNISAGRIVTDDLVYVPRRYVSAHQFLRAGDLLIAASSGSRTVVGKAARADEAPCASCTPPILSYDTERSLGWAESKPTRPPW
jgi:type I restriction enzyme S subunit